MLLLQHPWSAQAAPQVRSLAVHNKAVQDQAMQSHAVHNTAVQEQAMQSHASLQPMQPSWIALGAALTLCFRR